MHRVLLIDQARKVQILRGFFLAQIKIMDENLLTELNCVYADSSKIELHKYVLYCAVKKQIDAALL